MNRWFMMAGFTLMCLQVGLSADEEDRKLNLYERNMRYQQYERSRPDYFGRNQEGIDVILEKITIKDTMSITTTITTTIFTTGDLE